MLHGEVKRDTKITCYLEEDQSEFFSERRLKNLEWTLSEFIGFPIGLYVDVFQEKGVTDSEKDGTRGGQARREDHFDFKEEQSEFLAV